MKLLLLDDLHKILILITLIFQLNPWVTKDGEFSLPTESENCILVTVTDEEVDNVVKHVPKIETLVSLAVSQPFTSKVPKFRQVKSEF